MKLRDLAYLVALADHGSFRKAATAMGVAQPTLSVQVRKLEEELGAVLVDRTATPLRFTPAGDVAIERARSLLRDVDELERAVRAIGTPTGGALRLGVFPTLSAYLLPRVLGGVRTRFPDLDLLITEEMTAELLAQFGEGKLDAIVIALPVHLSGVEIRPLFREEFLFAVASDDALASPTTPVAAEQLRDTEVLLLGEGHCLTDQVEGWLDDIGDVRRLTHRASSLESLRTMVSAGVGTTLLPALSVQSPSATPDVVTRPIVEPVPSRDIALVWRTGSARGELLEQLAPTLVPQGVEHVQSLL